MISVAKTYRIAIPTLKTTKKLQNEVAELRHEVFCHILRCGYTVCIFPLNLMQIGQKTWLQGPKNRQNGRYDVKTCASTLPPNLKQIGQKTPFNREKPIFEPSHYQHHNVKIGHHHALGGGGSF